MSVELITLVIWVALLALLISGFPVAFSMLVVTILGYVVFVNPDALYAIVPVAVRALTKDVFIAIPLFIFMAAVLQSSGLAEKMFDTMHKWMAGVTGGLAAGTVFIQAIIAAMTGLAGTEIVTMGLLAYPEMRKRGYDKRLAVGSIVSGGVLGPIIPPSVPAILVAGITGVSTGKLFIAGIVPGIIIALVFMTQILVRCGLNPKLAPPVPVQERPTWGEKFRSLAGILLPLLLIAVLLGGIYRGVMTPTEAGGIGAVGALVCAALYGNLSLKRIWPSVVIAFKLDVMIMWLVVGGSAFASLVGITGVSKFVENTLTGLPVSPIGVLVLMLGILLFMGCFIDTASIIMITAPVMFPVALKLGFDPVWFCFILILTVLIGLITPPFGYNLFYFQGLGYKEVSITDIYFSVVPFTPTMLLVLALVIIFPELVIWLPNQMIK